MREVQNTYTPESSRTTLKHPNIDLHYRIDGICLNRMGRHQDGTGSGQIVPGDMRIAVRMHDLAGSLHEHFWLVAGVIYTYHQALNVILDYIRVRGKEQGTTDPTITTRNTPRLTMVNEKEHGALTHPLMAIRVK